MRVSRLAAIGPVDPAARPPRPAWVPAGVARRLDPLARLALAAIDALGPERPTIPSASAVVLHTAWGSLASTERFLTSIVDGGDAQASPTPFTTSVHNAAAGAVSELLALHGPCTTLSDGTGGAIAALHWARRILVAGRAPAVLVLVGEAPTDLARAVAAAHYGDAPPAAGMAVALIEPGDGPGRHLQPGQSAAITLIADRPAAGALDAAHILGGWWPGSVLAALARHPDPGPVQLREGDRHLALGPHL